MLTPADSLPLSADPALRLRRVEMQLRELAEAVRVLSDAVAPMRPDAAAMVNKVLQEIRL